MSRAESPTTIGEEEIKTSVSVMEKMITLKNIPQKLFDVFQKVFGGTSLEVVPIRYNEAGDMEIFMIQRPAGDTYWPNEWHVPGTMVFAWDWFKGNKFDIAWNRLKKREIIQNNEGSSSPVETLFLDTKRGAETAVVNNIVFKGPTSSEGGRWFPVSELPQDIITHHKDITYAGIHDFVASVKAGIYEDGNLSVNAIERMVSQITTLRKE